MKTALFTGVCTALVTPFLGEAINYPMLNRLLDRQFEAGIKSVVICGTTGEAPTLSDEEKLELFQRSKAFVGKDMKVIAGTGSNSTNHAVKLSKLAEETGVDGLLVVSPYYNKATSIGIIQHYSMICGEVALPVIVYNVPSRTGLDIPVEVYEVLSSIPKIAGIKEASQSITKIAKIRRMCPNLPLWSGNDDMVTPVISLGGSGVISVVSNVVPEKVRLMTEAALAGDFDTAAALQSDLGELTDALFSEVNPIPVKAAMKLIGFDCGSCRLPLTTMSTAKEASLAKALHRA